MVMGRPVAWDSLEARAWHPRGSRVNSFVCLFPQESASPLGSPLVASGAPPSALFLLSLCYSHPVPTITTPAELTAWESTSSVLVLLRHTWLRSRENPGGDQITVFRPMTYSILSCPFMSVFLELLPDISGCRVNQEGRRCDRFCSITSQVPWTKETKGKKG